MTTGLSSRSIGVIVAVALALGLTGCIDGDERMGKVKERSSVSPGEVIDTTEATAGDSATAEASATEESTAFEESVTEEPTPTGTQVGDLVEVGSWDIRVTKVQTNADEIIEHANSFNDKARGQYVLVTYKATYTGSERTADVTNDLSWSFTSADSRVFDGASQVTPADNQEWPYEARNGGTVQQQEVFDIPAGQIKGGILTVEAYDENYDTIYADFPI